MSTLVTINGSDLPTNNRADINGNFSALNTDKMETSVLDTDTTLAANSDSKIPSQKAVKAYVDSLISAGISTSRTVSTTHSLVTNGNQRVLITAKGDLTITNASSTIELKYNGTTKDTVVAGSPGGGATQRVPFSLTYTETPASATQNVTVTTTAGSISNVVITEMKFNV